MLDFLLYSLLPFLFILGFCITIHEFGHFLMAKIFRIPVEKFSIGYGPPIIRKKIGETDFRIAYFPLGGYVKMAGDDEGEILQRKKEITKAIEKSTRPELPTEIDNIPETETKPGFYDAPIIARILVVFNGPLFNILSAFIVFFIIFLVYGVVITPFTRIHIEEASSYHTMGFETNDSIISVNGQVVSTWEEIWIIIDKAPEHVVNVTLIRNSDEITINAQFDSLMQGINPLVPPLLGSLKVNSPAHKAGMRKNDRVLTINGESVHSWNELVELVRVSPGEPMVFLWQHGDSIYEAAITPDRYYDPITKDTIGQIGVFIPHGRRYLTVFKSLELAFTRTIDLIGYVFDIFSKLFTRQISARQIGGPIAIFRLSTESAQWGFERLLLFLVIISINLGIINLFPLPALDGGHIVIGTIEGIRRKRFSKKTRLVIQQVGYALLLLLIIFVTFNDITR